MRIHLKEAKYEFLKALRLPAYSLPTILFPVLFYMFFGVMFGAQELKSGVTLSAYLLATYGAFGVIGAALFGFGVSVAIERGRGWLEAKRTTPMPVSAYFFAKTAMAVIFSAIIILLLFTMGIAFGGVTISFGKAATLFAILIAGAVPFCALGLALATFTSATSATPIINCIYLPLGFLSGLWVPIQALPNPVQKIAFFLPPYHYSQLALGVLGADRGSSPLLHIGVLVLTTVICGTIAWFGFRRETTA
ncbi:MAG TPA: ABC transporter permease [Thermoanaerobaculia bacterium]